jgi:hypothetical protein
MECDPRFGDDWSGDAGAWTWMTGPPLAFMNADWRDFQNCPATKDPRGHQQVRLWSILALDNSINIDTI